ncbi:hypothetical protein FSP39_003871 [Pinctada imbricata]|uniref:WAP domain-containing protein n=1 Tax=Pinctada imbricata TaxID=66713 RepID=A0AA89BTZ6_PINIB|nr:hypothetical protein FSP39_003871 [Pinctada imbricata]
MQSVLCRLYRAHACYHPRSPTDTQRGQVVGALSSLKRFGEGPSWSPVFTFGQSESLKDALVQGCRLVQYHAECPSGDIRTTSTDDLLCPQIGTAENLNTDNDGGETPVGLRKCDNDGQCGEGKKCCNEPNGGTACKEPSPVAGGTFQTS